MGKFFEDEFVPLLRKHVEAGKSYDEVKRLVKIPTTWKAARQSDHSYPGFSCLSIVVNHRED
jgi:hypothetical protein